MAGIFSNSSSMAFLLNNLDQNHSKASSNAADDDQEELYHQTNEGDKKKFICNFPDCQKIFRYKSEIERHVAAHSAFRPHPCSFEGCGKSFKRVDALENHVRSQHTGEAPLICPHADCRQQFTTDAKLRYHIALHTGEKPYKCSISGCKRSFLTLSQLKQHEKSVSVHKTPPKDAKSKDVDEEKEAKSLNSQDLREEMETLDSVCKKIKPNMESLDPFRSFFISRVAQQDSQILRFNEMYDQIEMKFNQKQETQEFAKRKLIDQVLMENQLLKCRIESSEKLMDVLKKQLNFLVLTLPEETRQTIISKYNPGFGFHQLAHPFDRLNQPIILEPFFVQDN